MIVKNSLICNRIMDNVSPKTCTRRNLRAQVPCWYVVGWTGSHQPFCRSARTDLLQSRPLHHQLSTSSLSASSLPLTWVRPPNSYLTLLQSLVPSCLTILHLYLDVFPASFPVGISSSCRYAAPRSRRTNFAVEDINVLATLLIVEFNRSVDELLLYSSPSAQSQKLVPGFGVAPHAAEHTARDSHAARLLNTTHDHT